METTKEKEATTDPVVEPQVALPTGARLTRIESILTADPAIKPLIGKKEITVKNRDQSVRKFAPEVVSVTAALIKDGQEPFTALKNNVLAMAKTVLKIHEEPAAPAVETAKSDTKADSTSAEPSRPPKVVKARSVPNQNLSVLALLLSACQIAEVADTQPNAEERLKQLNKCRDEYQKVSNLP